jgi:hypothetical protein
MRRVLLTIAVLVVAAGGLAFLAFEFIPLGATIWDGYFDLTVNVSSDAGRLRMVSCEAYQDRNTAEYVAKQLHLSESQLWSSVADPFDGRPLTVRVPLSGRRSPLGRELRRIQFRYLVVIGQSQDGRRFGTVVEIPDCRVSQEVSASLR